MSHADSPQNLGVQVRWPAKSPRLSDASGREAEEPHPQSQQKSWQHLLSLVPDGQHSLAELAEERGPWQPHV